MLGKTTALHIRTPEGVDFEIPIASPFSRCLALALDFVIITALSILIGQAFYIASLMMPSHTFIGRFLSDFGSGIVIVMQFVIAIGYGITTEWLWSGRTVGKRLMKLRVIDERGLSLGFKQVIIRNLFRLLDMMPSTFYLLGGVSCFLTKRCQRLGDLAAGTLVIRETQASPPRLKEFVYSEQNSFASLPHLEARLRQRIAPEEARLVLDAVARRDDLSPQARLELFSQLADFLREQAEFPEEITIGLSDEQYVRNVAASLLRRASV